MTHVNGALNQFFNCEMTLNWSTSLQRKSVVDSSMVEGCWEEKDDTDGASDHENSNQDVFFDAL